MTLVQRLRKRLGYDVTEQLTETYPIYEYEVLHTNGKKKVIEAVDHVHDGAFLVLKFPDEADVVEPTWLGIVVGGVSNWMTVTTLEGIEQYDRQKVDELRLSTTYDWVTETHDGIKWERVDL